MAENIQQELYDRAWELAGRCVERPYNQKPRHRTAVIIAEAILAAKAEERDAVRVICMDLQESFLSPEYATDQPLSSIGERFAIGLVIHALEARSVEVNTAHKIPEEV